MKRTLTNRRSLSPIWIILGTALLAVAGLLLARAFLDLGSAAPAPASVPTAGAVATSASPTAQPDTATPEPSPTTEPLAASVNGYSITRSYLSQTVRLNQVLGQLSGTPAFRQEETLERLITSRLILQGVTAADEPTESEVEAFISSLEQSWGISDETLIQRLEAAGLERAFLTETVRELFTVEAAVQSLEDEGHNLTEWLREQRQDADIKVSEDLVSAEEAEATPTAQATAQTEPPTSTPRPEPEVPEVAPDFTLNRAGGGSFTLSEQLEEGPVVLVFFEKCG
jgi:hypothetical protein